MPFLGLGVHVLVALFFAVHAVRSGQERYWLGILFMFPGLGSAIYALTIWLPEMRYSRQGVALVGGVKRALDPTRELREAQNAFEDAPTTDRRLRLADALLASNRASEAATHYESALKGIHADDPDIQVRLAQALLECGHAPRARELLDELIKRRPDYRSPDGHLTYARAVAAEGDRAKAREEFETLIGYSSGFEAHACYAQTLADWGETVAARELCERTLAKAKRLPAYARRLNKPALDRMGQLTKRLAAADQSGR
ncbi:tetratricopeptide repeat protein [Lysobacter sp. 5GHs7-4]|uniref:tetratricopeptide repeat protein n=1 Tax=Lysobacter sp. 5GHs7-4 TaxID=2904253 RepID=UPI001E5035E4|nr:tetratricopeptide repeat protein [Lysobacter sp. 5GHs7-4]UHQ23760.1 tetratricopeptide repeat protein [Lysobacter sp. 5GHs7-4]